MEHDQNDFQSEICLASMVSQKSLGGWGLEHCWFIRRDFCSLCSGMFLCSLCSLFENKTQHQHTTPAPNTEDTGTRTTKNKNNKQARLAVLVVPACVKCRCRLRRLAGKLQCTRKTAPSRTHHHLSSPQLARLLTLHSKEINMIYVMFSDQFPVRLACEKYKICACH